MRMTMAAEPPKDRHSMTMQIGMVVGFATSVPMNWWLIKRGLKEKM
jgi:Domain of unknown function (DUF4396)